MVRVYLDYSEKSGIFTWKIAQGRCRPGEEAGSIKPHGYVKIQVCGERHYAHRLAWLYMNGEWPSGQIDHINGNRSDNKFENLRLATQPQNMINQPAKGIRLHSCGRWTAQIGVNYKQIYLGLFDTKELAHAAYLNAVKQYFGNEWATRKVSLNG